VMAGRVDHHAQDGHPDQPIVGGRAAV
jgi:hypothetical protein